MATVGFDPIREFSVLQDRVNRLFNDHSSGWGRRDDDVLSRGSWAPPVDIYEQDGSLVLKAELPEMKRENIDVTFESGTLTLRGERTPDPSVTQENVHRIERQYGSFSRSFSLPTTVDASKINAEYRDGVLCIKLPFREDAKPRTIKVEVAG